MDQKKSHDFYSFYRDEDKGAQKTRSEILRRRKHSRAPWIFFILFLMCLAGGAWYGYGFFSSHIQQSHDPITVSVSAPASVASGDILQYAVDVVNNGQFAFTDASILVDYPQNFIPLSFAPQPENTLKNFWNIGSLDPGTHHTLTIQGVLTGNQNDIKKLSVSLHYTNPVYRSAFSIMKTTSVTITQNTSQYISLDGPSSLHNGDQFHYVVHYSKISAFGTAKPLFLDISYPTSFHITAENPPPSNPQNHEWDSNALTSNLVGTENGSITITGSVDEHPQGDQTFSASLSLQNDDGTKTQVATYAAPLTIVYSDLDMSIALNVQGAQGNATILSGGAAGLGQTLPFTLTYKNMGTIPFQNVTISIDAKSPVISYNTLVAQQGGVISNHSIVWSPDGNSELKNINPGSGGTLSFSVPLVDYAAFQNEFFQSGYSTAQFQSLVFTPSAQSDSFQNGQNKNGSGSITGTPLSIPLLSDAHVEFFARPSPVVQQKGENITRVYFTLTNTFHDLSSLALSATLPQESVWKNTVSRTAGDMSYDVSSHTITWTLNKLPSSVHRIDGSFDVETQSSSSQKQTSLALLKQIRFIAQDDEAHGTIHESIPDLTMSDSGGSLSQ